MACLQDALSHPVNITMLFMCDLYGEISDVTGVWSNVERGRGDGQDVVDLAGMNNTDKLVAHHNDVEISGRQQTRKSVQRLIRQTLHIAQFVTQSKITHLRLLGSPTNKTENDLIAIFQLACSAEQRVERMTRTMIPGIHHDKPITQSVFAAKRFPTLNRKLNRIVMRPRRNHRHSPRVRALRQHTIAHEPVQHYHLRRVFQAVTQHPLKAPRNNRIFRKPTRCNRFIRVEVHHPETETSTFQPHKQRTEKRDQRRRRQRHNHIKSPQQQ